MAAVSMSSRASQFLLPFSVTDAKNTRLRISLTFNKRISHPRRSLLAQARETATSISENETEEAVKPQPSGPKKGTKVRILREESYWYNGIGSVVAVDQDPAAQYPVIVRFNNVSYANVSTNNYALDEIVEIN